jgi:hypothetical protein
MSAFVVMAPQATLVALVLLQPFQFLLCGFVGFIREQDDSASKMNYGHYLFPIVNPSKSGARCLYVNLQITVWHRSGSFRRREFPFVLQTPISI